MESIISVLYPILTFVVALGVLVFVHEFGHFLMARLSGMRVNAFALGMGWRLFGWNKVNGFTFGPLPEELDLQEHCDYRLAAFPIGGYCQIAGMVDESFDVEFQNTELQPWEFRTKGPFKQGITIAGGVIFNILLAIILFSIVALNIGETSFKTTTIGAVANNSIGEFCGFKVGDSVISINNVVPNNWAEVIDKIAVSNIGNNLDIKVSRKGFDTTLNVNGKKLLEKLTDQETKIGLHYAGKTIVADVMQNGLASENGIEAGDTILAVNSEPIHSFADLISKLQANKNQNISITTKNQKGKTHKEFVLNETGTIGVQICSTDLVEVEKIDYNIFQAINKGIEQTYGVFRTIIMALKQIIVGNMSVKSAIGGPVMIAKQSATFAEKGIISFISFTAMLSVSLALVNILPFPALDGGHLMIIIIEAITRKQIPINVKLNIQKIGMGCLLALIAYITFNDIIKLL